MFFHFYFAEINQFYLSFFYLFVGLEVCKVWLQQKSVGWWAYDRLCVANFEVICYFISAINCPVHHLQDAQPYAHHTHPGI